MTCLKEKRFDRMRKMIIRYKTRNRILGKNVYLFSKQLEATTTGIEVNVP